MSFCPVTITDQALEEIRNIRKSKGIPDSYSLRIGMQGGSGCGSMGMSFLLGFDEKGDNDEEYSVEDIQVLIDKKHMMYVLGVEVDFVNTSEVRGFAFKNVEKTQK